MTDELVKRLRIGWHDDDTPIWVSDAMTEAADRIEALTAEREALEQDIHRWKMECENFWRDREKDLTADRDRLREALTALHKQTLMLRGEQSYREFARAVEKQSRAALKGESHE